MAIYFGRPIIILIFIIPSVIIGIIFTIILTILGIIMDLVVLIGWVVTLGWCFQFCDMSIFVRAIGLGGTRTVAGRKRKGRRTVSAPGPRTKWEKLQYDKGLYGMSTNGSR
eukprot:TRINITY_DN2801_c0_g1_i1.p1 TRINITY_DN2801_c0_g1~~TRINITY_DN2801_c0_g1_i1.p1  ORF type:complete len:111 (-),score=13.25 TRINITY_DN2801_c0_g1_i1:158-490(-)